MIDIISLPQRIIKRLQRQYNHILYKKTLKHLGANSHIYSPLKIHCPKNIYLGNNVHIGMHSWLAAVPLTGEKDCELVFQDGATIGDFNHIYATGSIVFEKDALTANFVYISDNLHCFEDVESPIINQSIKQLGHVTIGEGCWIGEHVSIIGSSIGKHSVIGANSVVTHDIPDFCVAVGNPAKVIKKYDFNLKQWIKC